MVIRPNDKDRQEHKYQTVQTNTMYKLLVDSKYLANLKALVYRYQTVLQYIYRMI